MKGHYRLSSLDQDVSLFGSLSLGLSQLSTPEITVNNGTTYEGDKASSIGIRPAIGVDLGGLQLTAAYIIPMNYTIESETGDFKGTAGVFSVTIGYRYNVDFSDGIEFE